MIFADKLIRLRKKNGWSQEELADQMAVTRQSISKWEGAQSVPDLEKMVRLSELFGVSTDYLLKDELEEPDPSAPGSDLPTVRRVSMEEANAFLKVKEETAVPIALGVFLCILSPICLLLLGAMSEAPGSAVTENMAGGLGMIVLLVLVALAVAIFILNGSKTEPFAYLEKEVFETEYGVTGMVRDRQARYKPSYVRKNVLGACLCLTALIPLFVSAIPEEENDLLLAAGLSAAMVLAGVGVVFFIQGGVVWASYEKLLQEGDYSRENKVKPPLVTAILAAYWLLATAIFLAYSLSTDDWGRSWIIWVVAGVLYPAVKALTTALHKK